MGSIAMLFDRRTPTLPTLDREALSRPVEGAQRALDDASSARRLEGTRVKEATAALAEAEAAFDDDPSTSNERAVTKAKAEVERRTLLLDRSDRLVRKAATVVDGAREQARAALLAHLTERADGAADRVVALFTAELAPLLVQVAAGLQRVDAILADAHTAAVERAQLLGVDHHPHTAGVAALRTVLRSKYASTVTFDDRKRIGELAKD